MSVLITGMKMPSNCDDCPLNYDSIDCMVADNALRENGGGDFLFDHERHPNCPLVPVPPHGRLIDADAFIGTIRPLCEEDKYAACTFETVKRLMIEHINNAPTVIEAELIDADALKEKESN